MGTISLALLTLAPLVSGADPKPAATTHRLVLVEQFVADGAENTYWLNSTEAKLERGPGVQHDIEFGFDFERFEAKIGGEDETALAVKSGTNKLVIGEDPATQQLAMASELPVVNFLNGVLGRMESGVDRTSEWSEAVRVVDGSVLPGFGAGEVIAHFRSSVVPAGRTVLRMLEFETDKVAYRTNGSDVEVSFRGAALVDEDKSLSYHTLFEQSGRAVGASGGTSIRHTTTMFLEDLGGEPVIPIDAVDAFAAVHDTFTFLGEPELKQLYPDLVDAKPNPAWMLTTWLAGRLANGALGGVAESSVNPVPTLALGSVVLTDQSIAYAGNLLLDRRALAAGEISEDEVNIHDGQYRSPLQYALAPEGSEPVPMDERLALLGPEFVGAARVGSADDAGALILGFGMLKGAAGALLGTSSRIAPILSSGSAVPYAGVVGTTAGSASAGIATSTILLGAGGAAAVGVAVASSDSSSSGSGPPAPGNTSGLPCNTSVVSGGEGVTSTLHALGSEPGSVSVLFEPGDNIGDELEIFYNGKSVTGTGGAVTGSQTLTFTYDPKNEVNDIVVVATGGAASFWNYTVGCPQ